MVALRASLALAQQPMRFAQLAEHLLRGVPASLYVIVPSSPIMAARYATTLTTTDDSDPFDGAARRAEHWLEEKVGHVPMLREPGPGERSTGAGQGRWANRASLTGKQEAIDVVLDHPARQQGQQWRTVVVSTTPAWRWLSP